jgi:hypothetical protein
MSIRNSRIATVVALSVVASAAFGVGVSERHHIRALSPSLEGLASQMAHYRAIAMACRGSDGMTMNKVFWKPYLDTVPRAQRALFIATVKSRSEPELLAMSGPYSPLRCDDALDVFEAQYPAINGPFGAGPAAEPICWSDVTDANRCDGVGDDDIFAGVAPLIAGY